jgi:RNA polymerase sigma-70 factor (ECF subfamily)
MPDVARELFERGRSRWPRLSLAFEPFADRIANLGEEAGDPAELHGEDLFLAVACVQAVPGAAEAFRAELGAAIAGFVRTVVKGGAAADEVASHLLVDLLVGESGPPRLATYTGRGPLRAWLRMTAVRRALNAQRDGTRRSELDGRMLREAVGTSADPETAYLKQLYGPAFEQAFRDALARLGPEETALLRLHFGEKLPLGALAAMYGWSKPTASRRVAAAREALLVRTRDLLQERLKLSASEFESVLRLVRSHLDVTLSGFMKGPE